MSANPLVSILINNYNYGRFLHRAIESGLNQSYSNTEVVVVDDGSTDNSREIIGTYTSRIVPVLKGNGGQASAFNAGFAASRGEIICLLDADDYFSPEKVFEVVRVFETQNDAGWCFHPLRVVNLSSGKTLQEARDYISRPCDFRLAAQGGKLPFTPPATSGLCFRRPLLSALLPMPESESVSIGDHYLKLAASALWPGFYLGKALAIQGIHGQNAYTLMDNSKLQARIGVLTAFWIKKQFPKLANLANRCFARAWAGQTEASDTKSNDIVAAYLSRSGSLEKLEICFRAFYHRARHRPALF